MENTRNSSNTPGAFPWIRNTGRDNVREHLSEAKEAFPQVRMVENWNTRLEKKYEKFCARKVPVVLHTALYRTLKLPYPIDIGGIVLDSRMTSEMGTGSLRQSVGVFSFADFRPV